METIKKYLEDINSDENQIRDFLEANESEIKDFFKNLWEKQFVQSSTNDEQNVIPETETETAELILTETVEERTDKNIKITDNQPHTDMAKFGSDEKISKEKAQTDALAFQIKSKQITFTNGKVNQPYEVDFDFEKLDFAEIIEVSFCGLDKFGLEYFPNEKKIKGLPTEAGDHKVTILFKIKNYEDRSPLEREIVFIINPDPRVLWNKNIPTPEDIDYYKPDSDKAYVKVEAKKESKYLGFKKTEIARKDMVAASQRGRSHAIEGKPRDDDFALYFDDQTEWYVMVVADGAGSAQYSREGARIACCTAKEICSKQLAKSGISEILDLAIQEYHKDNSEKNRSDLYKSLHSEVLAKSAWEAFQNISKEAQKKQAILKDYATTLIISICKKFDFGWFVGAFWVGDGAIGIYSKDIQNVTILGEPDGGEFAGQTRFLTMQEIFSDRQRTRFEIVKDFTAIMLMSDGITDPKFETDANLNKIEKWNELWEDLNGKNEDNVKVDFVDDNEQSADQLLKWLDFWSKGNHDDRTIAILY